jgi:cell division septal protein FtsQ
MNIKTNKSKEVRRSRAVPPPDKSRSRKKAHQKVGTVSFKSRRCFSALKTLGKLGSFLLLVAIVASILAYAYTADRFNLREIEFVGCSETDPEYLEQIVRKIFPANILSIDLGKLKSRLEAETWIKHVEIRRVLPSNLTIYVEERTPTVILEMQNELMIADGDGILLGHYDPRFGKLDVPVFRGVLGEDTESYRLHQERNSASIRQAVIMLSEIESGLPGYTGGISEVDISDPKNLKIMLVDDTAEVYLGGENFLDRLNTFLTNQDEYQKLKNQYEEFASIDLRFKDQIIYRPRRLRSGAATGSGQKLEDIRIDR